jgi:hypothetical protein
VSKRERETQTDREVFHLMTNEKRVWSRDGMILTGKLKFLEKSLSQYQFVQHKSHMDWPGIEPKSPQCEPRN